MKFYRAIAHTVLTNLAAPDQKKGIWIIVLMIFNALLDFFSVAAFLPLMATVIDPEFISGNSLANNFYIFFKFTSHASFVLALSVVIFLFVIIKNLISFWITKAKAHYAFNIRSDLSSRALAHYMQRSFLDFVKTDFTRELHTITSHPLAFANNIILPITTIISEAFVGAFILACMVYYDYKVLLLVAVIFLPLIGLFRIRKKNVKKISDELKTTYPIVLKYVNQVIEGFVEIMAYQKQPYFYKRFNKISEKLTETFIKDQTLQAGTIRLTEIMTAFIMCSLIIYAVVKHQQHQQTLVLLGIYAGASFRIVPSINRILQALQQIRTHEYLLEEFKIPMNGILTPQDSIVSDMEFNETIEFKNISFQYPNGPQTLNNLSFVIKKGEKVAITGSSGEGKTTILLMLLGFLQQTEGELVVNRKTVYNKSAWRKLIGYVPQNPYILDGTIIENIAFGTPLEDIDRTKALQLITNLGLNSLIHHLPNGIDTHIGERGAKLSGGQRQRLAIARALYTNADILLIDEGTNQVHSGMELEIMGLLNNLANKKKTIIMVTHKMPQANFFDTIYRLEKGSLYKEAKTIDP